MLDFGTNLVDALLLILQGVFLLPILGFLGTPVDPEPPDYEIPPPSSPPSDGTGDGAEGGGTPGEPTPANVSRSLVSVDQGAHTATYLLSGSYSGNTDSLSVTRRFRVYLDGVIVYNPGFGGGTQTSASFNSGTPGNPSLEADNNQYSWRAGLSTPDYGNAWAELLYFKTAAVTAVANAITAPTGDDLEATQALITATCYPNTLHSIATLQLQYKQSSSGTWIDFGTSATTGGYSLRTIAKALTGLTPSTSYDVRLKITRTTVNETEAYSSTTSFTTPAADPTITTDAATIVTATGATLNATVELGDESSVNVKWVYGTANPPVAGVGDGAEVAYASNPVTGDGAVSKVVTGLSASTTYYFFAKVYWNSDTESSTGSVLSFTTPADPAADAVEEDHMQVFEFNERKYGVQSTFYFAVASPAATSSDRFFNDASPFSAGDVKISKDGGALANTTNLPSRVGTSPIFSLTLVAAEMQASTIVVQIVDQDGPAFRDAVLVVRTKQELGNVDIDASQLSNTSALKLTGVGTGHGLEAVGGATGQDINGVLGEMVLRKNTAQAGGASSITLDASASGTNDYYNGSIVYIIAGTGAGQARVITDYVGSTAVATVHKAWSTNPSSDSVFVVVPGEDLWEIPNTAELSGIPAVTATWRQLLTFLFQRFAFKRTQTATTHTMFKADSSTSLGTATVGDSGGTQTFGKLS